MEPGSAGNFRVETLESGETVRGEVSLPGISAIPFFGTFSPAGRLSGTGAKTTCGEGGTIALALQITEDTMDLRIREADGPGCRPDGPFDREWQIAADVAR
jgi:hypothetical protein